MGIENDFIVDSNLINFLKKRFAMTDSYLRNRLMWWDFNHFDPRVYENFGNFYKKLEPIGDFHVSRAKKIPVSHLNVNIDGITVPIFLTIRPYTTNEIKASEIYSQGLSSKIPSLFDEPGDDFIQRRLDEEAREDAEKELGEAKKIKYYYKPHARGVFLGRDKQRIYYFPFPRKKNATNDEKWMVEPELEELVLDAIHRLGYPNINTVISSGGEVVDRVKGGVIDLTRMGVIKPISRRVLNNINLPAGQKLFVEVKNLNNYKTLNISTKGFKYIPFYDFPFSGYTNKKLLTYAPLEIVNNNLGIKKTIPLAVTTKDPFLDIPNEFTVLGIYVSSNKSNLKIIPFTNPEFAVDTSLLFAEKYNIPVDLLNSSCLVSLPGKNELQIIPHKVKKFDSTIYPKEYLNRINNNRRYMA